jgi:hypothetical protein
MGEYLLGFFSSWMERGTTDRSWRHIRTKIGISTQLSQYCERLNPALNGLALFDIICVIPSLWVDTRPPRSLVLERYTIPNML